MKTISLDTENPLGYHVTMSRAVRFGLVAIVLCLSLQNIRMALVINKFQRMYSDMLPNGRLPPTTTFILHHQILFVCLSVLFPIGFVAASVFMSRVAHLVYACSAFLVAIIVQIIFQYDNIITPTATIVQAHKM